MAVTIEMHKEICPCQRLERPEETGRSAKSKRTQSVDKHLEHGYRMSAVVLACPCVPTGHGRDVLSHMPDWQLLLRRDAGYCHSRSLGLMLTPHQTDMSNLASPLQCKLACDSLHWRAVSPLAGLRIAYPLKPPRNLVNKWRDLTGFLGWGVAERDCTTEMKLAYVSNIG
jgi:hypothetical protein